MPLTMPARAPVQVAHHESGTARWELASAEPAPPLRGLVRRYTGWWERSGRPYCLREMPTEIAPVIINFGAPTRIFDPRDPERFTEMASFATGAFDRFVLVGASGPNGGVQIDFTLLGSRLFLGRPLRELANRVVPFDELAGADARRLAAMLHDAPSWDTRFAILDHHIAVRILGARGPSEAVRWTWRRLTETAGRASIRRIVEETGRSQRHLIDQFRGEIGLPPKTVARVLRFGRALKMIRQGRPRPLADIAVACGYYDQAHFVRDTREFAGVTPSALVASLSPDSGGFAADW